MELQVVLRYSLGTRVVLQEHILVIWSFCFPLTVSMDNQTRNNTREWAILCHNIRGINSEAKWNSIKNKIKETNYEIIYLQETKREHFDAQYIRNFCPRAFDSFSYTSSIGNSGKL
jgi:hypothetical protein